METAPRLLVVMGSGETSPTMVSTHRDLLGRLGPDPVPAVVLDTPFGFQTNAAEVAARTVAYFRQSVGHPIEVASHLAADGDPLLHETMLDRLRHARYVFSGPGSPSYALRQWRGTQVTKVLAEKLRTGGCITFSSAAALTLGVATIPVYEIYKAGEEPLWLEGLDLLSQVGLRAVVIPHYNNAEGGTHDTRFCYLGERRLARMEEQLPAGAFVLGVDEHTALILDLEAETASVTGLGVVTVRCRGVSVEFPSGTTVPLGQLASVAEGATSVLVQRASTTEREQRSVPVRRATSPLMDTVARLETAFDAALTALNVDGAVRAALELELELGSWAHDTLQSDEVDRARASLRSMVVRLGALAQVGIQPRSEVVGPFVDALLSQRDMARAAGRFETADAVRNLLVALGVEVQDAQEGTRWRLLS